MLGREDALNERLAQVDQPHVAPLNAFVRSLRLEMGGSPNSFLRSLGWGLRSGTPLLLLEALGPKARDSGFISRNNPDTTAKNLFELSAEAGIPRKRTVVWNVVPWYIGTDRKIRAANLMDVRAGLPPLLRLLESVPRVNTIALVGKKPQLVREETSRYRPRIRVVGCPHPSPLFVNRRPKNRQVLLDELVGIAGLLGT